MQGINIIKPITIGNNITQQKDINWSKRILGNDALTHIKTKIIIHVFSPKLIPYNIPSQVGSHNIVKKILFSIRLYIWSCQESIKYNILIYWSLGYTLF